MGDHVKIVLWGSTGLTGREVLSQALDAGHEVKIIVRNLDQIKTKHNNLSVVQGDVLNPQSVMEAVTNGDVVISAVL